MTTVDIQGKEYEFFRSAKCSYKDRFNRAVKLAYQFEKLESKFDGMIERGNGTSQNARLALACKLMMHTGIRIGNEGSAEGYMTKPHPNCKDKEPEFVQTYGLTTMLPDHITFKRGKAYLNFLGKKQVENSFVVTGELAKQLKVVYKENEWDTLLGISAYELTKFIKVSVGKQFVPKDLRTMRANMYASEMVNELSEREECTRKSDLRKEIKEICTYVSEKLNNTPAVCKKSYIDPYLWDEFESRRYTK